MDKKSTSIKYLLCAELTGKDGDRFRVAHFKALRKIDTYIDNSKMQKAGRVNITE